MVRPTKTISFQLSPEEALQLALDAEAYSSLPKSGKSNYIRKALQHFRKCKAEIKEDPNLLSKDELIPFTETNPEEGQV